MFFPFRNHFLSFMATCLSRLPHFPRKLPLVLETLVSRCVNMFACALPPENHQPKTLPKLAAFSCNKKIASSFTEFAIKTSDEDVPIFWPGLPPISTCLMHRKSRYLCLKKIYISWESMFNSFLQISSNVIGLYVFKFGIFL